MNKTILSTAVAGVLGTASFSASALSTGDHLSIVPATAQVTSCILGTTPPCNNPAFNETSLVGSFFNLSNTDVALTGVNGIIIGATDQQATAATPTTTAVWSFNGANGSDGVRNGESITPDNEAAPTTLDFTGWSVQWNGIADIPMGGDSANITCDTAACDDGEAYTLTYSAHVPLGDPSNFGGALYTLTLSGVITAASTAVPVPAAVWLFGSGLLGLVGVARRKTRV